MPAEQCLCVACEKRPANSDEHVFQSALGGRLAYPVLCKDPCNDTFGRTIDKSLLDSYHGFRVLLGIAGDRGQVASMQVVADDGREFVIESGGKPRLPDRAPQIVSNEGIRTTVRVNSTKAAKQFIRALERKNPNPARVVSAERIQVRPGVTDYRIIYGGDDFYRATLKSGLVFMAGSGAPVNRESLRAAWAYVNGGEQTITIISMPAGEAPWWDASLGELPHLVSVEIRRRQCRIDVRHFGHFATLFMFDVAHDVEWSAAYGIDPLTRTERHDIPNSIHPIPQDAEGQEMSMEYAVSAVERVYIPRLSRGKILTGESRIDAPDLVEALNRR